MARIRTIKPEFFTSEDIVSLTPTARLLYIAIWCEADRDGRLVWKPKTLKLRYLPADECNVENLCAELVERGLVKIYGENLASGEKLAYIPSFGDHQHINPRETRSTLPSPDASPRVRTRRHASNLDVHAQGGREGKGRERKGKEGASSDALPEWLDAALWAEFVSHREDIRKPLTEKATERMLAKLATLRSQGVDLKSAIDDSIRNGWQDVFAPKVAPGQKSPNGNPWDGAL